MTEYFSVIAGWCFRWVVWKNSALHLLTLCVNAHVVFARQAPLPGKLTGGVGLTDKLCACVTSSPSEMKLAMSSSCQSQGFGRVDAAGGGTLQGFTCVRYHPFLGWSIHKILMLTIVTSCIGIQRPASFRPFCGPGQRSIETFVPPCGKEFWYVDLWCNENKTNLCVLTTWAFTPPDHLTDDGAISAPVRDDICAGDSCLDTGGTTLAERMQLQLDTKTDVNNDYAFVIFDYLFVLQAQMCERPLQTLLLWLLIQQGCTLPPVLPSQWQSLHAICHWIYHWWAS